jgi:hypothetical protein
MPGSRAKVLSGLTERQIEMHVVTVKVERNVRKPGGTFTRVTPPRGGHEAYYEDEEADSAAVCAALQHAFDQGTSWF